MKIQKFLVLPIVGIVVAILLSGYTFVIEREVASNNYFSLNVRPYSLRIGTSIIGRLIFTNNSHDGFTITITSLNGGTLDSSFLGDGDNKIPYTIEFLERSHSLDANINKNLSPQLLPNIPVTIFNLSNLPSVASSGTYDILLNIDDTSDRLTIAGDYQDTITITYTDL